MSDERATVRPVTLPRLVELTNHCEDTARLTDSIESTLGVTHRRARETILEALRIGLVTQTTEKNDEEDGSAYATTSIGDRFLQAVHQEDWQTVSDILATRSPHYSEFLKVVSEVEPAKPEEILEELEARNEHSPHEFNQTVIEVVGDWGERLGAIQRNAFTGSYYRPIEESVPSNFQFVLLSVFDDLEERTGVNLNQRYLSIPELREHVCEKLKCTRTVFDEALLQLASQNVGKLELSGAPVDTGAKEAKLGIKQISRANEDGLVSTTQSTDRVMAGVEQHGKQYYYLAIHSEDLTFTMEDES